MDKITITQSLLKLVDEWWTIIVPVFVYLVSQNFIKNFIVWVLGRFNDNGIFNKGSIIFINGKWFKINEITFSNIYLEGIDNKEEKVKYPIRKFWSDIVQFKG